jgi:nitric oxide reductase subunit C
MGKLLIFSGLFVLYLVYGAVVYTRGTTSAITVPAKEIPMVNEGKEIFQQYNCVACHQLYGLGGYLGPELTTAWSDKDRGEGYMKAFLKGGGQRMPNFHFTDAQVAAVICFLKYVDETATTYKKPRQD